MSNIIDDPYVMDYNSFLEKYAGPKSVETKEQVPHPALIKDIKQTLKKEIMEKNKPSSQYKLDPDVKIMLIDEISNVLTFLFSDKTVVAKDVVVTTGIQGCYLSLAKNKKYKQLSDFMAAVIGASFNISVPGFDADKILGEFRGNKVAILRDFHLGSNYYTEILENYKADTETLEELGLIDNEENGPIHNSVLGKPMAEIIEKESTPTQLEVFGEEKEKPLDRIFNTAAHMPKESIADCIIAKPKKEPAKKEVKYDPHVSKLVHELLNQKAVLIGEIAHIDILLKMYEI